MNVLEDNKVIEGNCDSKGIRTPKHLQIRSHAFGDGRNDMRCCSML